MKHSNCYMVWGGDLVSTQQTRFSQEDMVVGCLVDLATGLMTFTANGKEINTFYQVRKGNHTLWISCVNLSFSILWMLQWSFKTRGILFQVEPNTKLFPAVFVQPTNQNLVQLELGKLKVRNYFCSAIPKVIPEKNSFLVVLLSSISFLLLNVIIYFSFCDYINLPSFVYVVSEHHAHLGSHVPQRA